MKRLWVNNKKKKHALRVAAMEQAAIAIRGKYPKPLIAAIGGGNPNVPYDIQMGLRVGQEMTVFMNKENRGTLFTGGMGGVGVDIFVGVVKHRLFAKYPNHFFVLIPESEVFSFQGKDELPIEFREAEAYTKLAALADIPLVRERVGESLADRRVCLAATADFAICLHGTGGTLDEAASMIRRGKPVIVCEESGGISADLCDYKERLVLSKDIDGPFLRDVVKELPFPFDISLIIATKTIDDCLQWATRLAK